MSVLHSLSYIHRHTHSLIHIPDKQGQGKQQDNEREKERERGLALLRKTKHKNMLAKCQSSFFSVRLTKHMIFMMSECPLILQRYWD